MTNGAREVALYNHPMDVACDRTSACLYIADSDNQRIRKLTIATGMLWYTFVRVVYNPPSILMF
jgi:hypothetical protein